MLLKLVLFFTINIFFIHTKCNSYYIRRKFFENLFFLNYNSNNLNNFDIDGNKKIKTLGKKKNFVIKLKSKEYNEIYQNSRRKYKYIDKKFPACFFLTNGRERNKLDIQCDEDNHHKWFYISGKYKNKKDSLNINSRIYSGTFDSIFKENFNENDRLKKSELISILACICTNIVIQYLKIKEEKKMENFDYSFDYSVMNILKLVNFEYDVNEEIEKKKKKKYKKKKKEYIDKRYRTNDNADFENNKIDNEYTEEVNINIDNKNTKEEDERLNEYIKKLEYNTLELTEIEPYIDLFFGKKTYKNIFIKHNIDIQKIYKVLNEALFDKCKEKENVIQLQKFVEEEEKTLKKKKINVRNAKTFNDYMHNFNALEEKRNIEEVENILYDDMNNLMENETIINDDIVKNKEKKKKKKKRENSQITKWKKENKYEGKLELDSSSDGDDDDDGNWENENEETENEETENEENENRENENKENENEENENRENENKENENEENENRENENKENENEENENEENDDNYENKNDEKINSLSYILIKNCNNLEKEKNEDQKEDKSDIILIKFIYDNKYKCEFRTDIGVIVYDMENDHFENLDKIKMINIGKECNDNIIISGENKVCEKNELNDDSLKFIEKINLYELYSLPYKKRYKKKQRIIKEINKKINYDNVEENDKKVLLYTYLRIWNDDLHFYELNKFDIKMFEKDKNNGEEIDENISLNGKKKYNFFRNYNYSDKEEILITSGTYNKIISSEKNLEKRNKNIYDLLSNDENFFNDDFISFNLNLYINNRKVINNIEDLINILKSFNCYFSKNILNYLIKIKKEKNEFLFLSYKQFLNNYTFNEEDELFSVNKILDKCRIENRYINLFGKDENGNYRNNRFSKLFVFPIASKYRLKKYKFIKNVKLNIFDTRKGMNFCGEKRRNGTSIYSIIDDNKKNKRKNREKNMKKNENNYITQLMEDYDTDFSKKIDNELINFENINNIIELKDGNKENIEKEKNNSYSNDDKKFVQNEKSNIVKKSYFKKMIEKQKKINDFLSLENMKGNIKKHINIVDLDGAIKYFTNEEQAGGKNKKFDSINNINDEEERKEFNYNKSQDIVEGINKMEEIELDESIKKMLQNNNMHRLNTIETENKINIEKKKEEKEKINNFFKDMKAQVKISNDTCVGCGISFQTIDKKRLGYLRNHIYKKVITDEENSDKDSILKEIYEVNENFDENKKFEENVDLNYKLEFEEIIKSTKKYIQKQNEKNEEIEINEQDKKGEIFNDHLINNKAINNTSMNCLEEGIMKDGESEIVDNKPYICERCFDLKYKNRIKNNLIINYSNKNEISAHDFEKYVINIFKKKCFIIYIVDILDLYIYSNLQKLFKIYKKLHSDKKKVEGFYFCINKIDLLKGYKEFTVKTYIHNFLKNHKINILFNNIFLISAKTGYNVKKLIYTVYVRTINNTSMNCLEEGIMKDGESEIVDNKPYICERCFDLKYKNRIKNNLIINYSNKNEISAHDFEKYVINIFKKKCFIIYIVDILDLYIYSNLQKLFKIYKKLHSDKKKVEGFYFCINKIDLLKGYKEFTVKTYIHNFLKNHKINILFNNIFLISAKTGYNVKKLIYTVYVRSKNAFMKKKKKKKKENSEDFPLSEDSDEEISKQNEEAVVGENEETGDQNEEYKDFMSELYENDKNENEHILKEHGRKKKKRNPKNVNLYIVGNANSGKSTLINYLLKSLTKEKSKNMNSNNNFLISNSIIPGTTLKNIKIKLNNNLTINDTPGIISNNSILSYLNFDEMKYVVCTKLKKKIPSIYINENDYIFIGGIVYINILNIKKYYSIMSFFMSDKIPIIKRKRFSKDPKEFLKKKIQSGYIYPPFSVDRFNEISDFKKCHFNINNPYVNTDNSSYDIHIQGLGCITFYSFQNIEFDLYTLKNVDVIGRPSLMPYHKKYGMLDFSVKKKI
ncbi:conserved Plasmodium protein, unknown function [Plasmodium berghei]|uniref:G domain-containing protein n=1 Tax=Plasmodium berghei TaxID=5821 RepID=A0A1D3Q5K0_PLABE|nr:conserved Plasmodium protein, unknown function [Plasmodium berghei]